jgi:hypothetical protein
MVLPGVLVGVFGICAFFYVLWFMVDRSIFNADGYLIVIILCCIAAPVLILMRGAFIKLYRPTIVTISTEGIILASYKAVREWRWDQIDHAEVRRIQAAKGGSFSYACLCLKTGTDQRSLAVKLGFADDPGVVALPAKLKSSSGVESAQSVRDMLNSVLAAKTRREPDVMDGSGSDGR